MVLDYALPDAGQAAVVLKGRLRSLAKGIRWAELEQRMQGLSHAELVRGRRPQPRRSS